MGTRGTRLVVSPSLLDATEGLSDGPAVNNRPASLGLLVVTLRNIGAQLDRSHASLVESQERQSSLQSLPLTELVSLAQVSPSDKMPTVVVRKLAQDKVTKAISSKEEEVSLCVGAVEGLSFLIWRHLEHFLLYSTAAETAGPSTPYQQAFSRHSRAPAELGAVSMSPRTGFSKVDLDRLKVDANAVLNDLFFDKLGDSLSTLEKGAGAKQQSATGFLQSVLRRTKRLASLHTQ